MNAVILGFVASVVGHVCAAVPTIRALFRLWCGSLDDASSRPSRFAFSSKRSWFSRSSHSQSNHSRNFSMQNSIGSGKRSWFSSNHSHNLSFQNSTGGGKGQSEKMLTQHHFGALPSPATEHSIALSDLQPIRERIYQPSQYQRHISTWNSGRSRWAPEEQPPAIIREHWRDPEVDDESSEKGILQDRNLARTSSVKAIEAHIESMEARMTALEAEIQYGQDSSDRAVSLRGFK